MSRLKRWLLPGAGVRVSKDRAVDIARGECERRGLVWLEPVRVYRHYGNWSVWTNADKIGGNIRIIVDRGDGQVVSVEGPMQR